MSWESKAGESIKVNRKNTDSVVYNEWTLASFYLAGVQHYEWLKALQCN